MSKKDIYQAVLSIIPFRIKEYISFEKAVSADCLFVIRKIFNAKHTTSSKNDYLIYNYQFINTDQKTYELSINDWKIEEIEEGYFALEKIKLSSFWGDKWGVWNTYLISDPAGELRRKSFELPEVAIHALVNFSKFSSWNDFEINEQINDLLKE